MIMLLRKYYFIFCLFFFCTLEPVFGAGKRDQACNRKLKDDPQSKIYTEELGWKEPVSKPAGDAINLKCSTGFVSGELKGTSANFLCEFGNYNGAYKLPDLLCRSEFHKNVHVEKVPADRLNSSVFHCNDDRWAVYEVSVQKELLYQVCLDKDTMLPKYSYRLPRFIIKPRKTIGQILRIPRKYVWGFDGYGDNAEHRVMLSRGYTQKYQKERMASYYPERYSNIKYPYYFNRGHLTAYADFGNEEEQKATGEYLNTAPQWELLNKHSWSFVEQEARTVIQNNPAHWEIYTGTYGKIITGNRGPIFLAPFFNSEYTFIQGQLPVPLLFWKLVHNIYDKSLSRVFIGINNPEIKRVGDIDLKYKLCTNFIRRGKKLVQGSEYKGFTYECPVDEFLVNLNSLEKIVV